MTGPPTDHRGPRDTGEYQPASGITRGGVLLFAGRSDHGGRPRCLERAGQDQGAADKLRPPVEAELFGHSDWQPGDAWMAETTGQVMFNGCRWVIRSSTSRCTEKVQAAIINVAERYPMIVVAQTVDSGQLLLGHPQRRERCRRAGAAAQEGSRPTRPRVTTADSSVAGHVSNGRW